MATNTDCPTDYEIEQRMYPTFWCLPFELYPFIAMFIKYSQWYTLQYIIYAFANTQYQSITHFHNIHSIPTHKHHLLHLFPQTYTLYIIFQTLPVILYIYIISMSVQIIYYWFSQLAVSIVFTKLVIVLHSFGHVLLFMLTSSPFIKFFTQASFWHFTIMFTFCSRRTACLHSIVWTNYIIFITYGRI